MADDLSPAPDTAPVTVTEVTPAPTPAAPDWRDTYAASRGGDEKLKSRLQRYASPEAAFDALISVQNKISAGELRSNSPYPEKGTPEQQAEWRQQHGIPEAPDKYQLKFRDGFSLGETDKPVVDSFLKHAHARNLPNSAVNESLNWYFEEIDRQHAALERADAELRDAVDNTLRSEWGGDYSKNKALITAFLESGPAGTKDLLLNARLSDGTPLASNIGVLRWLAAAARDANPTFTLVPQDGGLNQMKSVEDEINNLRSMMGNKQSEYWTGPKAESNQKRYRELVDARERLQKRAA